MRTSELQSAINGANFEAQKQNGHEPLVQILVEVPNMPGIWMNIDSAQTVSYRDSDGLDVVLVLHAKPTQPLKYVEGMPSNG